jgi:hypothetical protein
MSTGLIIALVVVALLLVAFLVVLPRMRAAANRKKAERELQSRRDQVAGEHRDRASQRERQAEMAEQKARIAQSQAEKERAEAQLQHERASMHERGMADDELIDDHERDRFADVSASADRDGDGSTMDDRARSAMGRDDDRDGVDDRRETGATTASEAQTDYDQGRLDERRDEEGQGGRFDRAPARDENHVR